jgi:hypothetical protein
MECELIDKYYNQLIDMYSNEPLPNQSMHIHYINSSRYIYNIETEKILNQIKCGSITSNKIQQQFTTLLIDYDSTIAKTWADCGKIEGVYLKLNLKPGSKPFKFAPYNSSFKHEDEITKQIKELLAAGFISPSNSNYASPVLMVPKKIIDGKALEWRMKIDIYIIRFTLGISSHRNTSRRSL